MQVVWEQAPLIASMRPGAPRRMVSGQRISVVRVETSADAPFDGRRHRHASEQWVIVISGTLRLRCGDEEALLGPGCVSYIPSGAWHAATGVGPEGAEYLELFAPPRLDLLPGSLTPSCVEFEPAPSTSHAR